MDASVLVAGRLRCIFVSMTELFSVEAGPVATLGYMIVDPSTSTSAVIDVPYGAARTFLDEARQRGCRITHILLTHTHWDHTADVSVLVEATGARVVVHAADTYRLTDPMAHTVWPLPFVIGAVTPDDFVDQGDAIDVAGCHLRILHTPGHTEGGICFVDDEAGRAFVGDTLFRESVGRTDLPGGDMDTLIASIHDRLMPLPDAMTVFPGHGPSTSIGHERLMNPFL